MPHQLTCEYCQTQFSVTPTQLRAGTRHCSMECRRKNTYTGRFVRSDGYVSVSIDGTYYLEHRVVMERFLGRKLDTTEHVHHRNGNKADNRLENLEVLRVDDHARLHHPGRDKSKWVNLVCPVCNKSFQRRRYEYIRHPSAFCSRKCYCVGAHLTSGRRRQSRIRPHETKT